jgi:subtilisin family serine protease
VASLRPDGELASDSNWGQDMVDLAAPGSGIISTHPGDDGYAYYSGTSMAAPHVTGAAALCRSVAPGLSARRLRELVLVSAAPTASLAGRTGSGGRLDIPALMERCSPGPAAAPVVVDDQDSSFKRGGSGWVRVGTGHGGNHYRLPARDDVRLAFGAWRPTLPVAGRYRVVAYIPDGSGLSRAAAYKIRTADGWVTRVRNQDKRRGGWVGLGIHQLTTTPSVRLADLTGEPSSWGRWLAYDAIRFVPLPPDG